MIPVVHLITGLATGGAEMALFKILEQLDRREFHCSVISMTPGGTMANAIQDIGIPVDDLGMRRGLPDPRGMLRLVRLLRVRRPAVLQTWLYHADLLGLFAARLGGVPTLAWNLRCSSLDERYSHGLGGALVRALARLSGIPDAVVVNSDSGLKFHRSLGYRPQRWAVIPNGFDLTRFRPDMKAYADVRQELGMDLTMPLIGLIARYDPLKDHATFLRAAAALSVPNCKTHFLLAGSGVDSENVTLTTLAQSLGLADRVHMLGERQDIARLTAAMDVATCCSTAEGFPNVLGEAMACEVPVVTTDVGDADSLVGDCGTVVPVGNPQALAAGWRGVLEMNREVRLALGARGRARIAEAFDTHAIGNRYAALYRELTAAAATH